MEQREIKFRAWDNVDYMSTPFTLNDLQCRRIEFTQDAKIMQYTGLKDKNGVEIYEGDIVKWGHIKGGEENPIRIAIVELWPALQFRIVNHRRHDLLGDSKVFKFGSFIYTDTEKWLEVIGNIYERPLLNSEQNAQECDATGDDSSIGDGPQTDHS